MRASLPRQAHVFPKPPIGAFADLTARPSAAKLAKPASVTQLPKPADTAATAADTPAAEKVVTLDSFRKK